MNEVLQPPVVANTDLSRAEVVYRKIKQQIISNEFSPGYQELEPALAQRMGVSRTPVREALIRLEAENFIELIPRRGMKVLPLDKEDILEMLQVLGALDKLTFNLLARKEFINLANLDSFLSVLQSSLNNEDYEAWLLAEEDFHLELLSIAGSDRLKDVVLSLRSQFARARRIMSDQIAFLSRSTNHYKDVSKFIGAKDWSSLKQSNDKHLELVISDMIEALDNS